MKFLLDVCVSSRTLTAHLVDLGHYVRSVHSIDPAASDDRILALALEQDLILVTEDKDFGELVFVRRLPHGPIIRLVELTVDQQVTAMGELLAQHEDMLSGPVLVTVTRGRIRTRR